MCWFRKRKKRAQEAARLAEEERKAKEAQEAAEKAKAEEAEKKAEEEKAQAAKEEKPAPAASTAKPEPIAEDTSKAAEAPIAKKAKSVKPKTDKASRYAGKYEIYPEAGLFKFRLKASNGEILLVSNGYTTRDGALEGIKTLKKNLPMGEAKVVTDKNGFSQFRIYYSTGTRLIIAGEFYDKAVNANNALSSTQKFAATGKIVQLEKIEPEEVREEEIKAVPVEKNTSGKLELFVEDGKWKTRLIASNGEVLFVSEDYATKKTALQSMKNIKGKLDSDIFRVSRDKQNRYQFRLYSPINQLLLVGETYQTKDAALSAVDSMRRFFFDAAIIDTTEAAVKPESVPEAK